jgi:formylglycine-generating enzyme required for sulfatase activity
MVFRYLLLMLSVILVGGVTAPAQIIQIHTLEGAHSFDLTEVDSITFSEVEGEPEAGEEREFNLTDEITIIMVWIPPGEFMMGALDGERWAYEHEYPRHRVTIENGFWMGKYEVTQFQWEEIMGSNPFRFRGANRPVEMVSWNDIQGFEERIEDGFRLPSEAEREYATCAGHDDARFFWGNDFGPLGDYAWYDRNSGGQTHEVGQKEPNPWGLHDIHGNVLEWCEDRWHNNYDGAPDDGSPWLDNPDGSLRIMRCGCWSYDAGCERSASRSNTFPSARESVIGFRLVWDEKINY